MPRSDNSQEESHDQEESGRETEDHVPGKERAVFTCEEGDAEGGGQAPGEEPVEEADAPVPDEDRAERGRLHAAR